MADNGTDLPQKVSSTNHTADDDEDPSNVPKSVEYRAIDYGNVLFDELASLWKKNMFCDVMFEVNSNTYRGHRIVLASISTYFRRIFCHTGSPTIRIRNMQNAAFEDILKFAYTGTIEITYLNVFEILFLCRILEITPLIDVCVDFAVCLIDPRNCFDVMAFAIEVNIPTLHEKALEFILRNQEKLFNKSDICMNSLESVLKFFNDRTRQLTRNGLPISSIRREIYFIKFLKNFVSSNGMNEEFAELINFVNLPVLPAAGWKNILQSHDDLLGNALVQYLLELSDLHRQGQHHECMPSFWDVVPKRRWNIVMDKPTTHPTETYVSKVSEFNDKLLIEPDAIVTSIELYFRPWWYSDVDKTDVLGGMKLSYDNGYEICHGIKPSSNSTKKEQLIKVYKITLERGELIHAIDVAFGWCVNRLTFYTNKGRQLGPFGGIGGDEHEYKSPANGQFGHFHCLSGREVMTYHMLALTHLQIGWAHFETSDTGEDQKTGENIITTDHT